METKEGGKPSSDGFINTSHDLSAIKFSAKKDVVNSRSKSLAELEEEKLFNDENRGEEYRKHLHRIVVFAFYVGGASLIALVLIRFYHLIAPLNGFAGYTWRWLDNTQIHDVERLLFSSIILGLATKYFSYYNIFQRKRGGDS